jgi:phospholipid/cholesterol/gamma-HCH transport system substrate-binding protein
MAAPLRRGRPLLVQRLVGVLFLGVIAGLVGLAVGLYQKAFTPVVMITVQADRIGNQLSRGADVKARGLVVGEVRRITSDGTRATLHLALDQDLVAQLPSDAQARMIPKTLFGEKIVDLVLDDTSTARPLRDGDVIGQDRSQTARETSQALDDLLPLLQSLKPAQLSTTLNALSSALRGRGDRLGSNLELVDTYLQGLNPELPALRENLTGLADLTDTLDRTAPDVLAVLDDLSFTSRSLVDTRTQLDQFLTSTTTSTRRLDQLLTTNSNRLIRLAADSLPSLRAYQRYSPGFACLAKGLVAADRDITDTFGGLQPGLHITLEVVRDQGGFVPGDEPVYGDDSGPRCTGLPPGAPVRPFPADVEPVDGYCDAEETASPGVDTTCRDGVDQSGSATRSAVAADPARALAGRDADRLAADRLAVGAVVGPVLGVPAGEVPDLALLLFGPVARGTTVSTSR